MNPAPEPLAEPVMRRQVPPEPEPVSGIVPAPSLRHLLSLCDEVGLAEHARLDRPRPEGGYCTDDAGRALALASRLPQDPDAQSLAELMINFLETAYLGDSTFHLRLRPSGEWTADPPSDDAVGRAILGLGVATSHAPWQEVNERARALFDAVAAFRSPWPRAMAYAALGAVEVLAAHPGHRGARRLVLDASSTLPAPEAQSAWRWPESRLAYANALLPEALLAISASLERTDLAARALHLLGWLVESETWQGRFSFTPVGGRGPGDPRPAFDQQPIEAWAMADACARAWTSTGDDAWAAAVQLAGSWFVGNNDSGVAMFDPLTGGGFDGLTASGPNRNQGAESSLAFAATMLQV
ncbi:MAG TPA: hypothetical protein VED59_09490, partial [Acidimicrobiales bacterium]|nr:hypothetical protein [Acidimicrobiales bacterium]